MTAQRENHVFQTEVARLLEIVASALYSDRAVFLRELISNASDACDKLRYQAIKNPDLTEGDNEFRIELTLDKAARVLTISDNGIGMNRGDLIENLGTIAKSGTADFMARMASAQSKEESLSLIGQFGVGFYSSFTVADEVKVVTRKAGESDSWAWISDGKGSYDIEATSKTSHGTDIILNLKEDVGEYLEPERIRHIVAQYSDHIALPIRLIDKSADTQDETPINRASALWTRSKSDITDEEYTEFYRHSSHGFDEPWMTMHWRAEGTIEYTGLVFIPTSRPFDLFDPKRAHHLKLYVKRVFITDSAEGLIPSWMRFLRGVVDSEDLPLNISRELLQHNPVLNRMRKGIVSRVLGELEKKAKDWSEYEKFWNNFGAVLKEGLYEDSAHRDQLLELVRVRSTGADTPISLADYVAGMKDDQKAIYYISGENAEALLKSPHLEGFKARGIDVLLMTDPVDEFWVPQVEKYKDLPFKSVTRAGADLSDMTAKDAQDSNDTQKDDDQKTPAEMDKLIAALKVKLEGQVKDVRISARLTESPVCLVADETDLDINLERMLRQSKQLDMASMRILEINPKHMVISRLANLADDISDDDKLSDAAALLLDQARILEGEPVADPAAFSARLTRLMSAGLG